LSYATSESLTEFMVGESGLVSRGQEHVSPLPIRAYKDTSAPGHGRQQELFSRPPCGASPGRV